MDQYLGLKKDILKHRDMKGTEHPFIGYNSTTPSYAEMNEEQTAYYLYWRSLDVENRIFTDAEGYVRLRIIELINTEKPKKDLDELKKIVKSYPKADFSNGQHDEDYPKERLVDDFCLVNGLELNIRSDDECIMGLALESELHGNMERLQTWFEKICPDDYEQIENLGLGQPLWDVIKICIRTFDRVLTENLYPNFYNLIFIRKTIIRILYRNFPYFSNDIMVCKPIFEMSNLILLIKSIADMAIGKECHPPEIDYETEELLKSVIGYVLDNIERIRPPIRERFRIPVRMFGEESNDPQTLILTKTGPGTEPEDLKSIEDRNRSFPQKYVKCTSSKPSLNELNKEQLGYYRYWRGEFFAGHYMDTDTGYRDLLITELLNGLENERHLETLTELYDPLNEYNGAIEEYIQNNTIERNSSFDREMDDLIEGKRTTLPAQMLQQYLCRNISEKTAFVYSKILSTHGKRLKKRFKFTYIPNTDIPMYSECKKFLKLMNELMAYVGNPDPIMPRYYSIEFRESIMEGQSEYEQTRIKLDSSKISKAEKELRCVTEMMKTDEESDEEETELQLIVTENDEPSDPWSLFMDKLNTVQYGYLKAIIEKTERSYLKKHGISSKKTEDEINGIALSSVGDTVLENGTIVEEYFQTIMERTADGNSP